jgi:hypothetical protein
MMAPEEIVRTATLPPSFPREINDMVFADIGNAKQVRKIDQLCLPQYISLCHQVP